MMYGGKQPTAAGCQCPFSNNLPVRFAPTQAVTFRSATPRAEKSRPELPHGRSLSRSGTSHIFRRTWRRDHCRSRTRAKVCGNRFRRDELQHRPSRLRRRRNLAPGKQHRIDTARHPSESRSRPVYLLLQLLAQWPTQLEVFAQSSAAYALEPVPPARFAHVRLASHRTRSLPAARSPITWHL